MTEASSRDLRAEAAAALAAAQRRLVHRYPFHAGIAAQWTPMLDERVETAAVGVVGLDLILKYNPSFIARCRLDELTGVLLHEALHVTFGHLLLDSGRYEDERALVLASELCVNEHVHEPLPGTPVLLAQYPGFPADEDVDARYRRLARGAHRGPRVQNPDAPGRNPGSGGRNSVPGGQNPAPLERDPVWENVAGSFATALAVVRAAVATACAQLTSEQWEALPAALRRAVVRGGGHGTDPGAADELLNPSTHGALDWRALLRRAVRRALTVEPTFTRPSRRFPELLGIVPGQTHRATRPTVMAVIDTSGSIDHMTLDAVGAELSRMQRDADVVVVECDAKVHARYPFVAPLRRVRGRGGTDLRPPFARDLLAEVRPSVIVYFTDGYGPAPLSASPVPTIWCLTPDGRKPAPWGVAIRMGV